MINFEINITHRKQDHVFKNLFCWSKMLSKFKALEIEFLYYSEMIFSISFIAALSGHHHAGIRAEVYILGYGGAIHMYDIRHWNHETNDWEKTNAKIHNRQII